MLAFPDENPRKFGQTGLRGRSGGEIIKRAAPQVQRAHYDSFPGLISHMGPAIVPSEWGWDLLTQRNKESWVSKGRGLESEAPRCQQQRQAGSGCCVPSTVQPGCTGLPGAQ